MWKVGDGGAYCCCVGGEGVSDVVLTAAVVVVRVVVCGVDVVVVQGCVGFILQKLERKQNTCKK